MEDRRRRQQDYREFLDAQVREKEANGVVGGLGGGVGVSGGRRLRRLAKPSERKTLLSQVICHQSQLMIHTLRGIHEVILPSRYLSEWQLFRPVSL